MRHADQDPALGAQQLGGLVQHDLHEAHVFVVLGGELARPVAGGDVAQRPYAALGLRDDLLRDHDHVAVAQPGPAGCGGGVGDQRGNVVARLHLRDAGEREELDAQLPAPAGWRRRAPDRSSWRSAPRVRGAAACRASIAAATTARSSEVSTS